MYWCDAQRDVLWIVVMWRRRVSKALCQCVALRQMCRYENSNYLVLTVLVLYYYCTNTVLILY